MCFVSFQSRRYDSRTTIFSPEGKSSLNNVFDSARCFLCGATFFEECFKRTYNFYSLCPHFDGSVCHFAGRLYQVEYAMEAIGHAGTCLGILANDGVLLAAERRNIHKLLDEVFFSEKIYKLNE